MATTAANVNDTFQKLFGRPAAQAGIDFYTSGPYVDMTPEQLTASIKGGAQQDDQAAMAYSSQQQAAGNAATTPQGWNASLDPSKVAGVGNVDFANGTWTNKNIAPITTPKTIKDESQSIPTYSYEAENAPITPKADVAVYKPPTVDSSVGLIDSVRSYTPTTANGGLATAATPSKDELATYQSSGDATATPTEFDPAKGTVSGLIAELINSPVAKRAAETAQASVTQGMSDRGLINSTLNLQAGAYAAQDALFNYAVQIGTIDAASYNDRMARNKAAIDQFTLTNKAANDRSNELTTTSVNSLLESNAVRETDVSKLNSSMVNTAMQLKAASENDAIFKNAATKISVSLANAGFEQAAAAFGAAAMNASSAQYSANQQQTNLTNANAANTAASQAADAQNKASMQSSDQVFQTALQTLRGTQATDLAKIEADNRATIQSSDSANKLFSTTMNAITVTQNDPNTTPEQKTAGVQSLSDMLKSGLAVISGTGSNVNLSSLLDWKPTTAPTANPQITALYTELLGRPPEAAGGDFYTRRLNSGVPIEQIRAEIMGSQEYKNLHP